MKNWRREIVGEKIEKDFLRVKDPVVTSKQVGCALQSWSEMAIFQMPDVSGFI